MLKEPLRPIFWYFLMCLPALKLLHIIAFYGWNLPYADQLDFVEDLDLFFHGKYNVATLFRQHNEHRLFFPRMVMLVLAYFSHWNIRYELFASFLISLGTCFFIVSAFLKLSKRTPEKAGTQMALLAIIWLFFSLSQSENWLWGWQVQIFLCVFCCVAGMYVLAFYSSPVYLLLSVLLGVIAQYSFASGVCYWSCAIAVVLLQRKNDYRSMAIIATSAVVFTAIYFAGYQKPGHHPPVLDFLNHPYNLVLYLVILIGSPVVYIDYAGKMIGGICWLLLFFPLITKYIKDRQVQSQRNSDGFWSGLFLFSCFTSIVTAIGRCGFGPVQAAAGRYVSFTVYFWVVLVVLLYQYYGELSDGTKKMYQVILTGLFIGFIYCEIRETTIIITGRDSAKMSAVVHDLNSSKPSYATLKTLHKDSAYATKNVAILKELKLGIYRE